MKLISYDTKIGTPVRLKKAYLWTEEEVADTGTWAGGADYIPGLDAGQWTVKFDKPDFRGHGAKPHWTLDEVNEYWEIIPEPYPPVPSIEECEREAERAHQMDAWEDEELERRVGA